MLRLMLLCLAWLTFIPAIAPANPVRIKDLVEFDGVRSNDLVGYGLVVGLNGTGDGIRNAPFTEEIMSNILERLGVNVTGEQFRPKNVAAVFVTASLPPFSRTGSQIDVTVSAIGDAKSLLGGNPDHDPAQCCRRANLCRGPGNGDCRWCRRRRRSGKRDPGCTHVRCHSIPARGLSARLNSNWPP